MLEMSITEKEIQDRMMSLSYSDKTAFLSIFQKSN